MLNTTNLNEDLITIAQAKGYLKCSHVFLWKRRKEGKIKSVNAGKKVLIVKASIDEYLNLHSKEVQRG
ncbi:Helix-turn-helix domain-containing protein [Parafilimonas terrae]|uniref:Helix-turn-helix domain-containing protein n=1 Tax=Parafilimonas terrae TaxID=1465490 RepID=A0A1I5UAF8_9BACT|nr:Helix-turn-helix domain-containing protein [Parafilimonas terrae]